MDGPKSGDNMARGSLQLVGELMTLGEVYSQD